jgi:hypothetical protein
MRGATGVLFVAPHFVVGFGRERPSQRPKSGGTESKKGEAAGPQALARYGFHLTKARQNGDMARQLARFFR